MHALSSCAFAVRMPALRSLTLRYGDSEDESADRMALLLASRDGYLARLRQFTLVAIGGLSEEELKQLLSGMPRLRALTLQSVSGSFRSLAFLCVPSLQARLRYLSLHCYWRFPSSASNCMQLIHLLRRVEDLSLGSHTVIFSSMGEVMQYRLVPCHVMLSLKRFANEGARPLPMPPNLFDDAEDEPLLEVVLPAETSAVDSAAAAKHPAPPLNPFAIAETVSAAAPASAPPPTRMGQMSNAVVNTRFLSR